MKLPKIKGITQTTAKKHAFEGFNVRQSKNGWLFQVYVSASARNVPGETLTERRAHAFKIAMKCRKVLDSALLSPSCWRTNSKGELVPTAAMRDRLWSYHGIKSTKSAK